MRGCLPFRYIVLRWKRPPDHLNDDPEVLLYASSDQFTCSLLCLLLQVRCSACHFRSCLLAFDGVAAVPEGYCCAGSALLFPFYPVVNTGCPYGVGLFRRILAVDIEAGVGCRVLALTCENSGEVFLDCAADTLVDLYFGGDVRNSRMVIFFAFA